MSLFRLDYLFLFFFPPKEIETLWRFYLSVQTTTIVHMYRVPGIMHHILHFWASCIHIPTLYITHIHLTILQVHDHSNSHFFL